MFWRLPSSEYEVGFRQQSLDNVSGGPNKQAMEEVVAQGTVPGLLAYRDQRAIGWVGVSPRSELVRLDRSKELRTVDEPAVDQTWSISCFYVHRSEWRRGVSAALLEAAVERAVHHGATAVEAYPVMAGSVDPYTGYDTMFADAGFRLVRPGRGRGRALWRRGITSSSGS